VTEDFDPTKAMADSEFDRGEAEMLDQTPIDLRADPFTEALEETPPPPQFLIVPNRYGPGTTGVYLADGTPLGVWLSNDYADLTPIQVEELLSALEPRLATSFAEHRKARDSTAMEIVDNPAVMELTASEEERESRLVDVRAAFVKAQQKK
jgi:hypothetical protein